MGRECEDCGESFETLTSLRLHDCGDAGTDALSASSDPGSGTSPSFTDDHDASVTELDDRLDRVADGEFDAVFGAVAAFESAQSSALEEDDGGSASRDVFWSYYEPVADGLNEATQSEGWSLLADVIEAYDPAETDGIPLATPAIANAVGRYVIRTRLADGVAAVPVTALEYLDAVAINAADGDDIASEEAHAYGWGIGHPDHSVVDRLRDRVSEDVFSVSPSLEHAFYADQHAAVDALERLVRDDSIAGTLSRPRREDMPYRRYLLDCVYGLKDDDHRPGPRYWEWREQLDYAFELDETVERRIRDLVVETGVDADLPDDWELRDLGI